MRFWCWLKDWRVRNSLPEILSAYQNPPLITRELRANTLAFQEPASVCTHLKSKLSIVSKQKTTQKNKKKPRSLV